MICLTGDIHHASLRINDQEFIPDAQDTEVKISRRYLDLLSKYGLKVTFYITGKTFSEEWNDVRPIAESPLVEIGGHTYSGLPRPFLTDITARLTGRTAVSHASGHGSYNRQLRDIRSMIGIVRKKTGYTLVSWRSHGLVTDKNTYTILRNEGIRFISDELSWSKLSPEPTKESLISHPLNVIMDHDHLYHAHRTEEYVAGQRKNWAYKDDPTSESYYIDKWADIVEKQVEEIERRGGVATVLMHPLCMYLADNLKTAERLFKFFSRFRTIWARETGAFTIKEAMNEP
ncbi:MAG: hypothetical protein E4H36_05115 [Spirochaetales bacterium]|nr:MAG: hypothetical protein E4H36_05115 [Spirochaetales bacterium]